MSSSADKISSKRPICDASQENAKDDQSSELRPRENQSMDRSSVEGQQPETESLGGDLTDGVEQKSQSVDAGSQEGVMEESHPIEGLSQDQPQVTEDNLYLDYAEQNHHPLLDAYVMGQVEKIDGGLAENLLKSSDDWAKLLVSEVDQATNVADFRASLEKFMKKFREEENTKVTSQQSIEVLEKENTKVALQQSIELLKKGNTKEALQQSIEVLKQENTKLALQNEMLKKENTKVALQIEVLKKIKTKVALQIEVVGKEKTGLMEELEFLTMQNRLKASDPDDLTQELEYLKQQACQYEEKLRKQEAENYDIEMQVQQMEHGTHKKETGTSGEHGEKKDQMTDKTEASQ